ncbi:short-chain dehydrogenase/reductase family protein [Favolaschia claudopus]|uniref:Short-chain dehydrogenase/reductase family protein n=1 Tax=Favolaschia claudopus TaxID=2862362 RepID=A0AAW0DR65_9AGAR
MSAQNNFSFNTTAEEVVSALASEIKGKNVLVTGTSINGIGFETARTLAKYANLVIITGHNQERLELSKEAIKKDYPSANIHCLTIDLLSFASIRKAAAEVNALPEPLHVLINNAASVPEHFSVTEDGIESQYATNHIGPFLFTKLVTPKILAAATSTYTPRVVWVSSEAHRTGPGVDFAELTNPDPAKYAAFKKYPETKSANVLSAIELSKRSKGKINSYSLDPGVIYSRAYEQAHVVQTFKGLGFLHEDGAKSDSIPWKTLGQGASTTVVAAFDPRLNDKPGVYLKDCVVTEAASHSADPAAAEKLWNITETIIGEKYTF